MLDQPLPDDGALSDEDVDDALRDPGLEAELAEADRRQRRQLGGLEDDRVPAGERGAELPARDVRGEVPRHDQADDAERLAEGRRDASCDRDRLASVLVDRTGVEVEDLCDHPDLPACARDRLADVARLDLRELLDVLLDEGREAPQEAGAISRGDGAPRRERRARPSDRLVRLLDTRLLERGDRLLGGGVDDGERHSPRPWRRRQVP